MVAFRSSIVVHIVWLVELLRVQNDGTTLCLVMPLMAHTLDDKIYSTDFDPCRTKAEFKMILKGINFSIVSMS